MITITSVLNPRWANSEHTAIVCDITTSEFGSEVMPFAATPNDPEEHGRVLFQSLVNGKYGSIAEYVPPPAQTVTPPSGGIPSSVL